MPKKLIIALAIALIIGVLYGGFLSSYISFENLKSSRNLLHDYVHTHYITSVLLYIVTYALVAGLALPFSALFTLAGGFLFGFMQGALCALIGATAGATISFLGARYLIGSTLQNIFNEQLSNFNREIKKRGAYYLLSVRLLAIIPFFLVNIIAGLTHIPLKTFVWTTIIGIVPGCLVYAFAGQSLATLDSVYDILSPTVIAAFILLALIALIPALWTKVFEKNSHTKL